MQWKQNVLLNILIFQTNHCFALCRWYFIKVLLFPYIDIWSMIAHVFNFTDISNMYTWTTQHLPISLITSGGKWHEYRALRQNSTPRSYDFAPLIPGDPKTYQYAEEPGKIRDDDWEMTDIQKHTYLCLYECVCFDRDGKVILELLVRYWLVVFQHTSTHPTVDCYSVMLESSKNECRAWDSNPWDG